MLLKGTAVHIHLWQQFLPTDLKVLYKKQFVLPTRFGGRHRKQKLHLSELKHSGTTGHHVSRHKTVTLRRAS